MRKTMSNIISVITSPFQLVIKLYEVVAKYRARLEKKKRAERDLAKSFSNETGVLYDFVWTMKATYVGEDRVKIDSEYFRFFKTYEDYILKEVDPEALKELGDKQILCGA